MTLTRKLSLLLPMHQKYSEVLRWQSLLYLSIEMSFFPYSQAQSSFKKVNPDHLSLAVVAVFNQAKQKTRV